MVEGVHCVDAEKTKLRSPLGEEQHLSGDMSSKCGDRLGELQVKEVQDQR